MEVLNKDAEGITLPTDYERVYASLGEELVEVSDHIKTAEVEEAAAEDQRVVVNAALISHSDHVEAYKEEKDKQYQITEKDKR